PAVAERSIHDLRRGRRGHGRRGQDRPDANRRRQAEDTGRDEEGDRPTSAARCALKWPESSVAVAHSRPSVSAACIARLPVLPVSYRAGIPGGRKGRASSFGRVCAVSAVVLGRALADTGEVPQGAAIFAEWPLRPAALNAATRTSPFAAIGPRT